MNGKIGLQRRLAFQQMPEAAGAGPALGVHKLYGQKGIAKCQVIQHSPAHNIRQPSSQHEAQKQYCRGSRAAVLMPAYACQEPSLSPFIDAEQGGVCSIDQTGKTAPCFGMGGKTKDQYPGS